MKYPSELLELTNFEKKAKSYTVITDIEVEITGLVAIGKIESFRDTQKLKVSLKVDNYEFKTVMDLKFIHQIGSRIQWVNGQSKYTLDQITNYWINDMIEDNSLNSIKLKIKNTFKLAAATVESKLVIIYIGESNPYTIYGIVSQHYKPTNQLEFRDKFIQICKEQSSSINTLESSIYYNKDYKSVTEYFDFDTNDKHTFKLSCGIIYGKNNGYGSYSIVWKREIRETKSVYLPFITQEKFNWKNNASYVNLPNEGINDFVQKITEQGLTHQKNLENRVKNLQEQNIEDVLIKDFFGKALSRIIIAKASKDRVFQQWQEEYLAKKSNFANTTWAISESLTFVGTHNKAVPDSMRKLLRQAGTEILDLGFEKFLEIYETQHLTLKANFGIDH